MALQMSMQNYAMTKPNPNAPGEDWEIQIDLGEVYHDDLAMPPPPARRSIWDCFC